MSKAVITLEDGDQPGTFQVNTEYGSDGFQVESNAHQHAMLMIKALNVVAAHMGSTEQTQIVGSDTRQIDLIGAAMDHPLPPDLAAAVVGALLGRPALPTAAASESPTIEIAPANSPALLRAQGAASEFNG